MNKYSLKQKLFEEICNSYSKDLQRFIYALTRKDQSAMEEIFQNTMLEALKGLKNLRENDKMKTWIFSIAKAEAKRYYSKTQNIINLEFNCGHEYNDIWLKESVHKDFTKIVADRDTIKRLLNMLNVEEQQIYILHYYYDLALKEISELLHINYNTVRSIHVRGLMRIKRIVQEEGIANEG